MPEHQAPQAVPGQGNRELGAAGVAQMPALGEDPALEIKGIAPGAEQVFVVVGLQKGGPAARQGADHRLGAAAGVGAEAQSALFPAEHEAHASLRVVRGGKGDDLRRAHGKGGSRAQDAQRFLRDPVPAPQIPRGFVRNPDRDRAVPRQLGEAADVVGVGVRYEDAVELPGGEAERGERGTEDAKRDADVDQNVRAAVFQKRAVAGGTAGKHIELHPARFPSESGSSGSFTMRISAPRDCSFPAKSW